MPAKNKGGHLLLFNEKSYTFATPARDIGAMLGSNAVTVAGSRLRMQSKSSLACQALFSRFTIKTKQYANTRS